MKKIISLKKGTCTYRAAEYLINHNDNFKDYQITEVNSFDEGINMIKEIRDNEMVILIPDLSDEYSRVVMDSILDRDMNNIFWYENPPLYLAKNKGVKDIDSCATLHTLRNLINDEVKFIFLNNTQESASYCSGGRADACITNQNGVDNNNLDVIRELKKMNVMWTPFRLSK